MFVIDRFEEDWAIIESENRTMFKIPRSILPPYAQEGDLINFIIEVDKAQTAAKKEEVKKRFNNFFDE